MTGNGASSTRSQAGPPASKDALSRLFARRTATLGASAIREICKLAARPEVRSLAGGWPDPATFPTEALKAICQTVLEEVPHQALQYGTSEGLPELREALAGWLARRDGLACTPDELLITSGSSQGMELAAKILLDEGDVVFVGLPTYFGGSGAARTFGAELVGIPVDERGMDPDGLERAIEGVRAAGKRAKLIYVIPDYQNPTGVSLPAARRQRIVELAGLHDLAIVEDSPYRDLSYEGEPLPPLKALDTEGRVLYLRSFSKNFCPGFRLAVAAGPAALIRRMVTARQFEDCCSNALGQAILLRFIEQGLLDRQIARNRDHYRAKRDALLASLERHFPDWVRWNRPSGGFFLFVHLPSGLDAEDLLAAALDHDVAFVAGAPFFADGGGANTLRLSFAQATPPSMEAAVAELGRLLHASGRPDR